MQIGFAVKITWTALLQEWVHAHIASNITLELFFHDCFSSKARKTAEKGRIWALTLGPEHFLLQHRHTLLNFLLFSWLNIMCYLFSIPQEDLC